MWESVDKMKYKKLTLIALIALFLLSLLAIFLFIQKKPTKLGQISPAPTPEQETPTMMISFTPNLLTIKQNSAFSANIQFDSFGNPVNEITIFVTYDPTQVTNVKLTPVKDPTSALSFAFSLAAGSYEHNPAAGTISHTIIVPRNIPAPKGRGILAKVTGTLTKGTTRTTVSLSKGSTASSAGSRLVLGKINLEINAQ